ncbi:uncharacterized protein EDB91DRAFT_1253143 [Suillus paluster]|uniref:uncharacterized protein n=1 Tax=Suillus paluster TaxID=48578 RepID=UPI001B85D986|nr:uncharacterized protein EDB91DRAFT_1253143 [Suillus paluster]KAG1729224.1 hypothetical protein EDB91DRAFT_1253143 [Suillus paluster]
MPLAGLVPPDLIREVSRNNVAVRGGIEDLSGPKLFFLEKAEKFVHAVLDLEPQCLALKLKTFVISGFDSNIPSTQRQTRTLNKLISDCQTIIQDELDDILCDKKLANHIKMNYNNYECSIVEHYGITLVGWPLDLLPIHNPSAIGGCEQVQCPLNALKTHMCHWEQLSEEQLVARIASNQACQAKGECVYKPRKKHAAKRVEKSTEHVESSDDEIIEKSAEFVDSDDEN